MAGSATKSVFFHHGLIGFGQANPIVFGGLALEPFEAVGVPLVQPKADLTPSATEYHGGQSIPFVASLATKAMMKIEPVELIGKANAPLGFRLFPKVLQLPQLLAFLAPTPLSSGKANRSSQELMPGVADETVLLPPAAPSSIGTRDVILVNGRSEFGATVQNRMWRVTHKWKSKVVVEK